MAAPLDSTWKVELDSVMSSPEFQNLKQFVNDRYRHAVVFPPSMQIFSAFNACPFDKVKVVIVGQDPYHGIGQANGMSFSVNPGVRMPPSLINIFKEITAETGKPIPANGDLSRWATQGVLLLNSILTVEEGKPESHKNKGWELLTDGAIRAINAKRTGVVFLLWGRHAISKSRLIDPSRHLVLTSAHPSPLSATRGFFGNGHFLKANAYLQSHNQTPIEW